MESRTLQLLEFPKILNRLSELAVSGPGAAACREIAPLTDLEAIAAQGRLSDQARQWLGESDFCLRRFPGLEGLLGFLDSRREILDTDALFALSGVLGQYREARDCLKRFAGRGWDELEALVLGPGWPGRTWSALRRCLDDEGLLRDESSPELSAVRDSIRRIHQRCTRKVKDFILSEDLGGQLQDDFMTISSDRYVLPLKVGYKNRLKGVIHDYSQTGETCYFEPMFLVEINNSLQELKNREREEERKVLAYLTGLARNESDGVRDCYQGLVLIDVLQAKAALGQALGGTFLEVRADAPLALKGARHPLLALEAGSVEPQDIELLPGHRVLVISGGNAGGKTVCLKTVGVSALMAFSGLPVPALEGSSLPFWSRLLVVMGDEQSLEGHVSTFTAQIRYLGRVWDQVGPDTLFILDEFGAGTDPTQGAALAQAVMDCVLERGAMAVAATHFPGLKAWAMAAEGVRAASVLFEPRTKRPLYRLAYDQVGASIALDVAREHGLPPEILAKAEGYLLLDGSDSGALIDRLNRLAVLREEENRALEKERLRLAKERKALKARFEERGAALLEEIRSRSREIVDQWREGKLGRKQALKELSRAKIELADQDRESGAEPGFSWEDLVAGSRVEYLSWGKPGLVLEKDDKRGQVKLDLDGMTMWVNHDDLGPLQGVKPPAPSPTPAAAGAQGPARSLDLRGMRPDEAKSALERFLNEALLGGFYKLEIIHGRGTGALRREVHECLRLFPAVESFSLATEERGGDGMTEVLLR
ncbi:MAG: Smr/MutS family protein [Desulfovibrionaceae bacterium]|nr:Smr/MutS family protein [Desulfovibrionaceae bacterium]